MVKALVRFGLEIALIVSQRTQNSKQIISSSSENSNIFQIFSMLSNILPRFLI